MKYNNNLNSIIFRANSASGSITLFAAVIMLPLLFFLMTISLDLTQLYSDRASMQRLIDEAALQGYRYLPYSDQAKQAVDGHLRQLNTVKGSFNSVVTSDSIEVIFQGVAPFTFAAFAGKNMGIPYEISTRVRGTVLHAAMMIDTNSSLAPAAGDAPWGAEGLWPTARLFTHFAPFGSHVSAREATQQCFNPIFSGLKKSALRLFDYLSSFSKNSIAVSFFPGTLADVDLVKDATRPGRTLTNPVTGYFNIANGPRSKNSYCLAALEEEPIGSPYTLPVAAELGVGTTEGRLTDNTEYLVPETSLASLTVRETLWSRAIRPGTVSTRLALSQITEVLSQGGQLNNFETSNRLADKPTKTGIILSSDLPREVNQVFPADVVKDALRIEIGRFWRSLGGGDAQQSASSTRLGVLYFVILQTPSATFALAEIEQLQSFFNELIYDLGAENKLAIRVVYSQNPEDLAAGVVRSLVIENNTAVIDR
jgi:Putative Flp pilus-assembly TadE/G-like